MKQLFTAILFFAASPLFATTYYANGLSNQGIDYTTAGAGWFTIQGASCVATGAQQTVGNFANGDVLDLNGCTPVSVDVDPGVATGASQGVCGAVTATVTLTTDGTHLGGGFTYATATNLVIHANISTLSGTSSSALAITGSTNGGTICGNIAGGVGGTGVGVTDSHTSVTIYVIGNITGGTGGTRYGYSLTSAGPLSITGIIQTGNGASNATGFYSGSTAAVTITGACMASATTSNTNAGCISLFGVVTITGNLINGLKAAAFSGAPVFTPGATNYICYPADSSYVVGTEDCTHTGGGVGLSIHATEMPAAPSVANVKSGVSYGTLTGTLAVPVSAAGNW